MICPYNGFKEMDCPAAARRCKVMKMQPNKYGGYADCRVHRRVYSLWYQMLRRCNDEEQQNRTKGKSYRDCFVNVRWLYLSNFANDITHLDGYQEWLANRNYCLDKNTKIPGNKIYAPNTCCFIPRADNIREANSRTKSYRVANEANKTVYYLKRDGVTLRFESESAACKYLGVKKCTVSSCRRRGYKCKGYEIECAKMDLEARNDHT